MRWGGGSSSGTQHIQEPAAFRGMGDLLAQEQAGLDTEGGADHRGTWSQAQGHNHPCTVTMREHSSRPSFHSSSTETSSLFPAQSQPCLKRSGSPPETDLVQPRAISPAAPAWRGMGTDSCCRPCLTACTRCPLVLAQHC